MNKHHEEYIGKTITITKTNNKQENEITGKIIDETQHTFKIRTKQKDITIIKKGKQFEIGGKQISGDIIAKRPEDRIKIKEK